MYGIYKCGDEFNNEIGCFKETVFKIGHIRNETRVKDGRRRSVIRKGEDRFVSVITNKLFP